MVSGVERNTLTLFIDVSLDQGAPHIIKQYHRRTRIINQNATTYANFQVDQDPYASRCREVLQGLSMQDDADELVAWTMIEYNR